MSAYAGVANFDDLSTGALAGQAGGSGFSGNWVLYAGLSGINVQNTVVQAGTQAIGATTGDHITERALASSVSSGDLYVALRTSSAGFIAVDLRNTVAADRASQFGIKGGNLFYNDGSGDTTISTAAANTWYIFNQNFISSTQWKVRVKAAGGSFNSFTGTLTYGGGISNPAAVMFETNGNSGDIYGDSLGTTDPDVPVGPANVKSFDGVTQSTGIKTYLGVAKASVKTVDGIT